MDKHNAVYMYSATPASLKKEKFLSYEPNLKDIKIKQPVIKRQTLYDSTYMRYLVSSNSQKEKGGLVSAKGKEKGTRRAIV